MMFRPKTYCMYKTKKLLLRKYLSQLTNERGYKSSTGNTNYSLFDHNQYLDGKVLIRDKRVTFQRNNFGVFFQRRHCSRCTFVDGKIPENLRTSPPWRVLFFGTDEFSLFTLKSLNENRLLENDSAVESIEVVTKPEANDKKKIPIRKYAEKAGLKVFDWPISTPPSDKYDVGVLSSFGHLIPERILHSIPYGILNVHPSLLPRWRGASPLIHTILNGDSETGVSIMELRPKHFDIGPILLQKKFPVPPNCTTPQLHDMVGPIGADMLIQCLYELPTLERLEVPQPEKGVTYAHKMYPEMTFIDWENQTVDSINRQYRAISDIMLLKSNYGTLSIRLRNMLPVSDNIDKSITYFYGTSHDHIPPGTPCYSIHTKAVWIKCKDGWVGFKEFFIKKWMKAENFNGCYLKNPKYKDTFFISHHNRLMQSVHNEKLTAVSS